MKSAVLPRARVDGLVVRRLGDETLVYDLESDKAHCLNETAGLVWSHCDGRTTVDQMAKTLTIHCGAAVDVDVVWLAIEQLQRDHLVEKPEQRKIVRPSVSRRKLILKYAPAALAVPVIMSITTPTAAQNGSCVQAGMPCTTDPDNCCEGLSCSGATPLCQQAVFE